MCILQMSEIQLLTALLSTLLQGANLFTYLLHL